MHSEKASICIPTYNNQATIRETLRSVLVQTYPDTEIIIRDDCSTDETANIVRTLIASDHRCKLYVNEHNIGIVANWNRLLKDACGQFIGIFHADDIYDKSIIAKQIEVFQSQEEVGVVFTHADFIDAEGNSVTDPPNHYKALNTLSVEVHFTRDLLPRLLVEGNTLVCPSALIRREVYDRVGTYNPVYRLAQDLEMWLRILSAGWAIAIIHEPLIKYRLCNTQASSKYHRNRTELSEHFLVLDEFIRDNQHSLPLRRSLLKQYQRRKARDLRKCGFNAYRQMHYAKAETLLQQSLSYEDRFLHALRLRCILMAVRLKLSAVVAYLCRAGTSQ